MDDSAEEVRKANRENRFAIRLSLIFGVAMLFGKSWAYLATDSAAIFSDAAESVVHVVAVGFAAFSLWLSTRPASGQFGYGYERISFFSAGFEGALIILAAAAILMTAVEKLRTDAGIENLGLGTGIIATAGLVNTGLGWFLVTRGRRNQSLILEANGKHVLADSWTSFGVVGGLVLVMLTGWRALDPIFASAVAVHILWSGTRLVWRSVGGLMDYANPEVGRFLKKTLDQLTGELNIGYHGVRFRDTGYRLQIELHLLFPFDTPLGEAHTIATKVERGLREALEQPAEVVTHLESQEDHGTIHQSGHQSRLPM
jgi:cation diffusion facilitator family transporter